MTYKEKVKLATAGSIAYSVPPEIYLIKSDWSFILAAKAKQMN